jgi:hypothetical protein
VVPSRKCTKNIPRRGRRSGRRGRIRRWKPLHISARIPTTIVTIAILMVTLRKSVRNYIQR